MTFFLANEITWPGQGERYTICYVFANENLIGHLRLSFN